MNTTDLDELLAALKDYDHRPDFMEKARRLTDASDYVDAVRRIAVYGVVTILTFQCVRVEVDARYVDELQRHFDRYGLITTKHIVEEWGWWNKMTLCEVRLIRRD